MSIAIGANNPLAASLLASYKAGAANGAAATAAGASSSSSSAFPVASTTTTGLVPAADASAAARDSGLDSAVQDFMSYANETPAQRMQDEMLKSMGLTEEDLAKMTPAQRNAVEQAIEKKIKDAAERAAEQGKKGFVTDVTA